MWETLDFHERKYNLPKNVRRPRIDELIELVELTDKRNELAKNLSGGMKHHLEIARGLLTRPKLLLFRTNQQLVWTLKHEGEFGHT